MAKKLKTFGLFGKAVKNTRHEMWESVKLLLILWLILSVIYFLTEHIAQPDVYTGTLGGFGKSLLWTFVKCIQDPGEMAPPPPITILGMIVANIIGLLGIAIFAVPAGIMGSGFVDAMEEEKHTKKLEKFHSMLLRDQTLKESRNLKLFLNTLPQDENAWYYGCQFKFIANNTRVSRYLLKGMDLKDILEVCETYPEFRVKNRASALSTDDEGRIDTYMLEHFPVNKPYGCWIDRGSKVTIVSTSSRVELDTGNFSFYLAKYGGFNYISKDFDADPEFSESYYNNPWLEPKVDGKRLEERKNAGEVISKDLLDLYESKKSLREMFLEDLKSLTKGEETWNICILANVLSEENKLDVHIAHNTDDGLHETVHDIDTYKRLLCGLQTTLSEKLQLTTGETSRFPLIYGEKGRKRNLAYKLQEDGCTCNTLTMRVSSHLMEYNTNMRVALFLMAQEIRNAIEPNHPLPEEDVTDMNRTGYGFMPDREQKVDSLREKICREYNV